MDQNITRGVSARRDASKPGRKRARDGQPSQTETQTAEPPQSGRHSSAPETLPRSAPSIAHFPNLNKPMTPRTVEEAIRLQAGAAVKREIGRSMIDDYEDYTGGRFELAEAGDMEAAAEKFLDPMTHVTGPHSVGNGGELVVRTQEAMARVPGIIDTLRESPDMLNTTASRERLELAGNVGALTMGVDAAQTIGARNSLEKMLAHQMAATHSLAMRFGSRAAYLLHRHESAPGNQMLSIEACRLAGASARLMGAYQDALVALERFRRGGRQTVKVIHQHVAVEAGGQAVVAGSMKTGGRKAGGRRRNGQ